MNLWLNKSAPHRSVLVRIKAFLLLHGEKLVLGVVSALALLIVYQATTLPRLDPVYQAEALRQAIAQTKDTLDHYQWEDAFSTGDVRQFRGIAVISDRNVNPELYQSKGGFCLNPRVVAPIQTRVDPPIRNAIDVQATGGTGMLAFIDEEVREHRQRELAIREEEKIQTEAHRRQAGDNPRPGDPSRAGIRPGSNWAAEPYDPDHPKRRPFNSAVRIPGVQLQGDERVERAYWACVVALVPVRAQLNLYRDSFELARGYNPEHDFPQYLGFLIERAEVGAGNQLEWQHVPLFDGQQKSIVANSPLSAGPLHGIGTSVVDKLYTTAAQLWAGGLSPDVVDEQFTDRILTLPLPPLVGRDWGNEASHPELRLDLPQPAAHAEELPLASHDQHASPFAADFRSSGLRIQSGSGSPIMASPPGSLRGYGPEAPRERGSRGTMGIMDRGTATTPMAHGNRLPPGVDYYLLRFFDFTVKPGKSYKYRVRIAIADPNYNVPSNALAAAVLDRQELAAKANHGRKPIFRMAEGWSDPSPTLEIPVGGSIRLAQVKLPPPEKAHDEPSALLTIEAFALDEQGSAIEAVAEEQDFRRGSVINLIKDTEYLGPGYIDFREDFRFFTGMTLLDINGGKKLTRDTRAPSRVLLMGPTGQLHIRSELDDQPFIEQDRMLFEKPNSKDRGPGTRMARGPA